MKTTVKIILGSMLTAGLMISCGTAETSTSQDTASIVNLGSDANNSVEAATEIEIPMGDSPAIVFEELKVNFGTINQGDKFEHDFKFTNTGDAPLLITNAKGSCGCTVPNYTREPIAPGASDNIHVVFNSAHKSGRQHKTVTLQTNASTSPVVLHLEGTVVVPVSK